MPTLRSGRRRIVVPVANADEAGLVESVEIKITLDDRTQYSLPGFLTISQERLAAHEGASLERLHKPGHLQLAMLVMTSLGNVPWLIELKNRRRTAALAARQ